MIFRGCQLAYSSNRRINGALLIFAIAAPIALFLPYWSPQVIPTHDQMYRFQVFEFFYSDLFTNKEIPLWLPYGMWGTPSGFFIAQAITPVTYLASFAGYFLGVSDALALFKGSILVEQIIFVTGMLAFTTRLCRSDEARALGVISALAMAAPWSTQPWLNFSIFYLMPWVLSAIDDFLHQRSKHAIGFACFFFAMNMLGNIPYFFFLQAYVIGLYCLFLLGSFRWPSIGEIGTQLCSPFFAASLILLGAYCAFLLLCLGDIIPISRIGDFGNSLETFLNYGRLPVGITVSGYLGGEDYFGDNTYYIGLLPLVLFFVGFWRCRDRRFFAAATIALLLFGLSLGGYVTRIFFYFPGMSLYRHVGLVFGLANVFVVASAAMCCDALLRNSQETLENHFNRRRAVILVLLLIGIDAVLSPGAPSPRPGGGIDIRAWGVFEVLALCAKTAVYGALIAIFIRFGGRLKPSATGLVPRANAPSDKKRAASPPLTSFPRMGMRAAVAVLLLDVGIFGLQLATSTPRASSADRDVWRASNIPFQERRDSKFEPKQRLFSRRQLVLQQMPSWSAIYDFPRDAFLAFDPCYPIYRVDVISNDVYRLLQASPAISINPGGIRGVLSIPEAIACDSPKIRILSHVAHADGGSRVIDILSKSSDTVVLSGSANPSPAIDGSPVQAEWDVRHFSPNGLELEVNILSGKPAILVYSDAHAGWRGYVQNMRVQLWKANSAFKAVEVQPGKSSVRFEYGSRYMVAASWFLGITGAAAALALLIMILPFGLLPPPKTPN